MNDGIAPLLQLVQTWMSYGQALVGAVGGLAFVAAFLWKMVAVESRSVSEAKRWIGRIVVGTVGVEMASVLVKVLVGSVPHQTS